MSQPVLRYDRPNWRGVLALARRETERFTKVHIQAIWAPLATMILYYLIFALAFGAEAPPAFGVPFLQFLMPGLVMMSMGQQAFANSSSSLVLSKIQGNIVDVLMAPLSPAELLAGYALGSLLRGLALGLVSMLVLLPFISVPIAAWGWLLAFAVAGSLMLGLLGVAAGIASDKFDHIAAVTNFVIMPATFLSGTFYSLERLPPLWQDLCHFNPFFYMIDGFRHGWLGRADSPPALGLVVVGGCSMLLWLLCWRLLASGWKLRE